MRLVDPGECFTSARLALRIAVPGDCTERYEAWLADPEVNRYLETRHVAQTQERIVSFVTSMLESDANYLFAICLRDGGTHIGNIKVGPIHPTHRHADVSYFIGDRAMWGRGYASEAISAVARIAFERLGLHRLQAGLYATNAASMRALEKVGFRREGCFREQLLLGSEFIDHLWYGLLRTDLQAADARHR